MPNLTNLNLKALLKTVEGELQTALYYNSNAIFAKDETESLFHTRKVLGVLEMIKNKIEGFNNENK
jgi:hypothetical protein